MHGVCHIEIPSKDFAKAKKFYGDIFNWECQAMPEMEYMTFKAPDGVGGGFNNMAEIGKPGFLLYLEVEDIPATLKKVNAIGGKTVKEKTQISPDFGYYAFFTDLEGNQIGLWSKN